MSTVPLLRVTPTVLDGDNITIAKIEAWFKKYKNIASFYKWDMETTASYLPLFFEGSVSTAYDSIPSKAKCDVDAVKTYLVKSLLTTDPYEAFRSRVMAINETFRDYAADLVYLANRMIGSNGDTVSGTVIDGLARAQFLSGISEEVSDKLRVLQLNSLEELVQRAEVVTHKKSDNVLVQNNAFYSNYGRGFGKGRDYRYGKGGYGKGGYGKGGYGKGVNYGNGTGTRSQNGKGYGRERNQEDRFWFNRCYNCGVLGHLARDCDMQVSSGSSANAVIPNNSIIEEAETLTSEEQGN